MRTLRAAEGAKLSDPWQVSIEEVRSRPARTMRRRFTGRSRSPGMAERAHVRRHMEELAGTALAARRHLTLPSAVLALRSRARAGLFPRIAVGALVIAAVPQGERARRRHAAFLFTPRARAAIARLLFWRAARRQAAVEFIAHACMVDGECLPDCRLVDRTVVVIGTLTNVARSATIALLRCYAGGQRLSSLVLPIRHRVPVRHVAACDGLCDQRAVEVRFEIDHDNTTNCWASRGRTEAAATPARSIATSTYPATRSSIESAPRSWLSNTWFYSRRSYGDWVTNTKA